MTTTNLYPKRLIEVDLPIRAISEQARREKSIRHGHISTLHIWWARRPLAACRAVTCAALWPDPADDLCPQAFREAASLALSYFASRVRCDPVIAEICGKHAQERWFRLTPSTLDAHNVASRFDMRYALLDFIADFSNWDASTSPVFLETARLLTLVGNISLADEKWKLPIKLKNYSSDALLESLIILKDKLADLPKPLVVDPFAGGGAIPLESLRIGADSFASDLNPVAVLLNKIVLEYIPKYGNRRIESLNSNGNPIVFNGLAESINYWGNWINDQAEKELIEYYPAGPDGSIPIAYLWARTIKCEGPGCGVKIPLIRSLWLAKSGDHLCGLHFYNEAGGEISIEIINKVGKKWVSTRNNEEIDKPDFNGTVRRGSVTCPLCGYTTAIEKVRNQLFNENGGTHNARLLCIVSRKENQQGRFYRLPNQNDLDAISKAEERLLQVNKQYQGEITFIPNEPTPDNKGHRAVGSAWIYGMQNWGDIFTYRQTLLLTTIIKYIRAIKDSGDEVIKIIKTFLACACDREAEHSSSLCRWNSSGQKIQATFGRQAIPMLWDFAETNPFGGSVGSWKTMIEIVQIPLETVNSVENIGHTMQLSATDHILPDDSAQAFITDPPYYDSIPYAELSDFFYVWLRRSLGDYYPDLFSNQLTPKSEQAIVWHPNSENEKKEFEYKMQKSMREGRRILVPHGIGIIVFAHKTTAGWEAQLEAMLNAGWVITGSWPIDTEMGTRMNAMNTASLASSIHLVCRPRENMDGNLINSVGDWRTILSELPTRVHGWLPHLAQEGVVGADAIFACLGPALEIFSRYSHVEKASGEIVRLSEYLEHVWATVSHEALNMIFNGSDVTGFEEDSRLTAMWLWTLKSEAAVEAKNSPEQLVIEDDSDEIESADKDSKISGFELEFDAARKIAQGLGAHLERLDGLVHIQGDKAKLLPVSERARFLFGKNEELINSGNRKLKADVQLSLFQALDDAEAQVGGWELSSPVPVGTSTLDQLHQSMLLFASGRSEALKRFLVDQGIGKDNRFWRLAQALSALYPSGTDEKRWVDGVLAKKKSFGF